ncbi:MAG: hypothetical protein LR011_05450 [Verrucomicrobia bacterium]|nr:hypothetical protein [Verrucomicrobiota bacterium]
MVIDSITTIPAKIQWIHSSDFLDEKSMIEREISRMQQKCIRISECIVLNLEENGVSCLTSVNSLGSILIEHGDVGDGSGALRCLTYKDATSQKPKVLIILGGDKSTADRLKSERFWGTYKSIIFVRTPSNIPGNPASQASASDPI